MYLRLENGQCLSAEPENKNPDAKLNLLLARGVDKEWSGT